jgi:hypothetical protein
LCRIGLAVGHDQPTRYGYALASWLNADR